MMALGLTYGSKFQITCVWNWKILTLLFFIFLYPHSQRGGYVAITLSVRLSVRSHFPLGCLSCYWKKLFYFLQCDLEFFMFAVMKTFVTVISASTGTNDFIFDIWLWHGDLYHVSPFQVYRTSTSCLPYGLEFFIFAVMKTFVTDISASTGRNDL